MEEGTFKIIFKDKVYEMKPFQKLMEISNKIRQELIFSSSHKYFIESDIETNIFESFLNYLENNIEPELNINTLIEYEEICQEFEITSTEVNNKKQEYGEYYHNLQGILHNKDRNKDLSEYEEFISQHLDEYVNQYWTEITKLKIQTLYNIFNHQSRRLNNQDLAYEKIKLEYEKKHDCDILILLDTLEMSQLNEHNYEESYSLYENRQHHMPKIDLQYLAHKFQEQEELETRVSKQEQIINKLETRLYAIQNKEKEREAKQNSLISELSTLVTELTNELHNHKEQTKTELEKQNQRYEQEKSIQQQKIDQLETLLQKQEEERNEIIKELSAKVEEQKFIIISLEAKIESDTKNIQKRTHIQPFTTEINMKTPGILSRLKKNEKTPFDHLFIPSQSSGNIYNIIDPEATDCFSLVNVGKYLEIELQEPVTINGIKIFSASDNFPKSFDIEIDELKIKSITEATELNGEYKDMTINIESIECRKIRIISTGPNWDYNNNYLSFKRIELLSPEKKYLRGVFTTLVSLSENHDPHKCPVIMSASDFDFQSFHLVDPDTNICTLDRNNSWFQIEFPYGTAILTGFRLKRDSTYKMKSYKIICTDDVFKSEEKWTTLIEINEQTKDEHEILDIYEFSNPSPPIKFVRLIQTGSTWNDKLHLYFLHFDLFGSYKQIK